MLKSLPFFDLKDSPKTRFKIEFTDQPISFDHSIQLTSHFLQRSI